MRKLIDKMFLFAACFLFLVFWQSGEMAVVSFLTAVLLTCLNSYLGEEKSWWTGILYSLLCIWKKEFLIFLPPVVYDCAGKKEWYFRFPWAVSLLIFMGQRAYWEFLAVLLLCSLGVLLEIRTDAYEEELKKYFEMQDATREQALNLERKNMMLMEKQDYEVRLATLTERNRIAREIHDNVGHLLTRSLLQISALQVVHKKEEALSTELEQVKGTLSDAMDSVRKSVHNLHEESVNLQMQLEKLIGEFQFCPVRLSYQAGEVPGEIKYCVIAIVKEALSNIAKHSKASFGEVSFREYPAFYQLIIRDNGTAVEKRKSKEEEYLSLKSGIGLQNIRDRVDALGGVFRIEQEKGFQLFISIPVREKGQNN